MSEQQIGTKPGLDARDAGPVPPPLVPPVLTPAAQASSVAGKVAGKTAWGAWATIGLGLALVLSHIMTQSVGAVPFMLLPALRGEPVDVEALGTNGLVIAIGTMLATPVSVGLAFLFARVKSGSWSNSCAYLGLRAVPLRAYVWALLTLAGLLLLWIGYARLLDMPDVPQVMVDIYRSAGIVPLLWAAVILAAPISEEVIFRGFFFAGLRHSRLGAAGAIVLPSLLWAAIHLQYGLKEMGFIVFLGLALGALRLRTNSLWPPILVHALSNLVSTIEVAFLTGAGR